MSFACHFLEAHDDSPIKSELIQSAGCFAAQAYIWSLFTSEPKSSIVSKRPS